MGAQTRRFWIMLIAVLACALPVLAASESDQALNQIAQTLATKAQHHRLHKVAVEPFADLDGNSGELGRLLAAELASELEVHAIQILDPAQITASLQKRHARRLENLTPEELETLGTHLVLDGFIAGSFIESAHHLRVIAKLVLTRTGSVVAVAKTTLSKNTFLADLTQPPPAPLPTPPSEPPTAPAPVGRSPENMVFIPAGTFIYGDGERLILPAFWIDLYEVTNSQYAKLRVLEYPDKRAQHPVTNISWNHARQFCLTMGKRLPTEQEWEKAARGRDGRLYPWGDTFDRDRVNAENRLGDATAVGSFEHGRSPYGAYDMAGNVMEWTDSGDQPKVLRGGSWASSAQDIRTVSKNSVVSGYRLLDLGFRCAKDAQ